MPWRREKLLDAAGLGVSAGLGPLWDSRAVGLRGWSCSREHRELLAKGSLNRASSPSRRKGLQQFRGPSKETPPTPVSSPGAAAAWPEGRERERDTAGESNGIVLVLHRAARESSAEHPGQAGC